MKKYRRKILILFLITIFMITIYGCNHKNAENSDLLNPNISDVSNEKETLSFRITWKTYSGRGEAINKIVDGFNEQNKIPYTVVLTDGDEDRAAIEALLQNGNGAATAAQENTNIDIYMLPYRYIQYFGAKHMLDDLTGDFVDEQSLFYPSIWKLSIVDQTVYGIPWLGHTMGLIFNNDLLEKAGVNPKDITNLDTLVEACKKVEAMTDAAGIGLIGAAHNDISWMVNQFIYGFGGSLVSEDGTKVTINSEESKEALQFYKETLGAYAQESWRNDTGVEVMDAFRSQKIAFEIQGLWGVTDIWKSGNLFETGVISLDSIGLFPEAGPMMLALPADMKEERRKAAIAFIQYMISSQAQEQIMEGEYSPEKDAYYPFRLPVRTDCVNSSFFNTYPDFSKFLTGFNRPSIDVPVPLWQKVKEEYYAPGLHQVMLNEISIEDFLLRIEEQGDKILNTKE